MVVSIQVIGVPTALAFLGKGLGNVKKGVMQGMNDVGLHMLNQVKRSVAGREAEPRSVDTSTFQQSLQFTATPSSAKIFSLISYAKFLEFGTTKMKARHHFQNSLNRNKAEIAKILQREVVSSVN